MNNNYWTNACKTTDVIKKIQILKKGAANGDSLCQNELGMAYMTGNGVPKDSKKASEYLLDAAKSNIPNAMYLLSLIYINWEGYVDKAIYWLCKSAKQCHIPAFVAIEKNYSSKAFVNEIMKYMKPKFEELMQKEKKNMEDYRFLGLCHIYGVVCNKDEKKARFYIQKASDIGDLYSSVILSYPHLRAELSN